MLICAGVKAMNKTRFQCRTFSLHQELMSQGHPEWKSGRHLPQERCSTPPVLCSLPAEREQCYAHGECLRATALLGQEGAMVLSWTCPCEPSGTIPQPSWPGEHWLCQLCRPRATSTPKTSSSAWWQQHGAKHHWFKGMQETQWDSITTCHPFYAFPTWDSIEKPHHYNHK